MTRAPRPVERAHERLRAQIPALDLKDLHRLLSRQQFLLGEFADYPPI
ncbi:MAG: hypothetical protein ACRDSJ_16935 [Rubrobacteraceae bacterium]